MKNNTYPKVDVCAGGSCVNLDGSYQCDCMPGYRFDSETCVDINECIEVSDKCGKGAECINTDGSFDCQCRKTDRIYDKQKQKCKKMRCPPETCSPQGTCISTGI
jgi:fibrillin 1